MQVSDFMHHCLHCQLVRASVALNQLLQSINKEFPAFESITEIRCNILFWFFKALINQSPLTGTAKNVLNFNIIKGF